MGLSAGLFVDKAAAALTLLVSDPKMILMVPFEVSFGFCGAFLNGHISPKVAGGGFKIGYLAALVSATAALTSFFGGEFIKRAGLKWPVMLVGSACFSMLGFLFISSSDESLSGTGTLVLLYMLQGIGRGVFESCTQGIISDYFPNDAPAAFANVVWSNGGATAFGYLWVVKQPRETEGWLVFLVSVFGFVGYFLASGLARGKKSDRL